MPEMLRLMESLEYERDEATFQKVAPMAAHYVETLKGLPADQLVPRKDEARNVSGAFKFLAKFKVIPADFAPKLALEQDRKSVV